MTNQQKKQIIAIVGAIAVALILMFFILKTDNPHSDNEHDSTNQAIESAPHDEHQHSAQVQEIPKGPHGGKLFNNDDYSVEVTIFEQDVPPEFRIYTYRNGQPLEPHGSDITIELLRLGAEPQLFKFTPENNYLKGDSIVEEPHSFNVKIFAKHNNKSYQFAYEQVEARVQLTDQQLTQNNIEVLTAGPASIKMTLNLQGEIKLNADKSVFITSRVGGLIESVSANAGDKVKKGQVLATISSQTISDMRSDLMAAQQRVKLAQSTYLREKQLWEEKVSAQQDFLQAEHDLREAEIDARRLQQKLNAVGSNQISKGLTKYEIRSPIDGVVTNKYLSQGQVVSETEKLYEISDLSSVWAEMTVYAKDINAIKVGQEVTIKSTAFEAEANGTISYVGALVGAESRTANARVVLKNPNNTWLPGLPVTIEVVSDQVQVPLAVSIEGLQTIRDWTVVFGRYGEFFEARPVELGRRDDKYVEVIKGIKAGDKYAAGNSFLIKADIGKAGASHDH